MSRDMIPIDALLKDFKEYLDSNDRCIFSARFGDGKSYFLSEFIKKYKNQYLFIPIYPVNYQVAENRDIFEYIKRDILIKLLSCGEINIDDTTISNSLYLYNFLNESGIELSIELLELVPDINLDGADISLSAISTVTKSWLKIKEKFDKNKSKYKNESQIAETIVEDTINQKGSIYEFDVVSQLICDLIDQYRKKHSRRKVVLLIEDLDRIDPAHIFRILNVFSAHFDRYNVNWIEARTKGKLYINKFKFDKVVTVCHYENIKNIYHHCYGKKTDFNGYIGKFSITKAFNYSLQSEIKNYILKQIHPSLLKYPKTCDSLASMIVNKYKNTEEGLWGNIRHITLTLKQLELIKREYIMIDSGWKICSLNTLTRFLDLLNRFDLNWNALFSYDNTRAMEEQNKIINECWLYAKYINNSVIIIKNKLNYLSLGVQGYLTSFPVYNALVEDNIIKEIPIDEIFANGYTPEIRNLMLEQKNYILKHFNSYLINYNENTIK